jgi:hypothetical protein
VLQEFIGHEGRITRVAWGALNKTILSAGEDGTVRLWDVEARARARDAARLVCLPPPLRARAAGSAARASCRTPAPGPGQGSSAARVRARLSRPGR